MPRGVDLPEMANWDERRSVLGGQSHWAFKGRIAVKAGDEGFNGKFNWRQQRASFDARVGGPLGVGTVQIAGDDNAITLTDKDGERTVLSNPEADLWYRYGWTVPVTSLRFWALGIPDPALPAETAFDEEGRLSSLEQRDWVVEFSRYRTAAGQLMPRTLTASNPDTRVRLVIDQWSFFER